MPNNVTTRCTAIGPHGELARFKSTCIREVDDGFCFDFNVILPIPGVLRNTVAGSDTDLGIEALTGEPKPGKFSDSALTYQWVKDAGISTIEDLRKWLETERPGALVEGRKALAAHAETGFHDWYDWAIENWGTKWNSYSFEIVHERPEETQFLFDTAWSFPTPIFRKLADDYPGLKFYCVCYDEGSNFAGIGSFNGDPEFDIVEATPRIRRLVYGGKRS